MFMRFSYSWIFTEKQSLFVHNDQCHSFDISNKSSLVTEKKFQMTNILRGNNWK